MIFNPVQYAFLLAILLLTGCAGSVDHGVQSPDYRYPPGATLTLNKPIEIFPGHATVWLQFGKVVARNQILTPEPHCGFELNTVSEQPQPVMPDRFEIVDARRSVIVSDKDAGQGRFLPAFFDGGSFTFMFYQTEFSLRSAKQPQVRALTCTSNQYLPGVSRMRHLTLAEIQSALGGFFRLDLPAMPAR